MPATETVENAIEDGTDAISGNESDGLGKKVLIPAAAGLGTLAATYAARKAPDLIRDHVKPRVEEEGSEEAAKVGTQALKRMESESALGKIAGKLGGGGGSDGKTRRLPIQRWTDVAVPVETAYRAWSTFEEFPKFMHRVLNVEKKDRDTIHWEEKIWFSKREWEGQITERRRNDRIAWKSTKGTSHSGIVSFHKLDTNLTRVMVTVDFHPSGMVEKMASGMRFVKRAVQADLARFKAYVEMQDVKGLEYKHEGDAEDADNTQDENADQQEQRRD